jgi:hypothetical protein
MPVVLVRLRVIQNVLWDSSRPAEVVEFLAIADAVFLAYCLGQFLDISSNQLSGGFLADRAQQRGWASGLL